MNSITGIIFHLTGRRWLILTVRFIKHLILINCVKWSSGFRLHFVINLRNNNTSILYNIIEIDVRRVSYSDMQVTDGFINN